ncbi:hypothetical protein QFZ40_002309 [Arthrobacter pascens]|uniref:hypothetical protein n=1 Tax=Arthrobacter pascens TaxID=1677 RepID=UPI002781797A|nr:hypothetical protein [Arthrobacter pascens]MDQ0634400.1 hypothetical protein [Arthrobacter pascens]
MRAIDLEARVISAIDRIRAGELVEHDLIECKRDWPQESKARQLAGSLNRAGGDPVIYIIGIHEKSRDVHDVSGTDVLDWWGQMTPKFDQLPPEMVRHISVPVGDGGKHVVAVAFASDRAPYLVKTGNANPSLEVPMREGTGTRTARRDELLRILIPTVRLPQTLVLYVNLRANYYPPGTTGRDQRMEVTGQLRLYVEHNSGSIVTLPAHGMRGRVTVKGEAFDIAVTPPQEEGAVPMGQTRFTFQRPSDGVVLSAPRAVPLGLRVQDLLPEHAALFGDADELEVDVAFEVLHATKSLKIKTVLSREQESNLGQEGIVDGVYTNSYSPGTWSFNQGVLPFDD